MSRERITLPNGDWVDVATRLNHGQAMRMRRARGTVEVASVGVAAVILGWAIRDVNDEPLPAPTVSVDGIPVEELEAMPQDTFDVIAERVLAILEDEQPDPLGSAATSSGSLRASGSKRSRSSGTPFSSPIIPAGAGASSSQLHRS